MTQDVRNFHIGDLISITEGHLVAPNHMEAIYDILDFLSGHQNFTHMLPTTGRAMEPIVYEQHPWLREIVWDEEISEIHNNDYRKAAIDVWLAKYIEKYGEFHKLYSAKAWADRKVAL